MGKWTIEYDTYLGEERCHFIHNGTKMGHVFARPPHSRAHCESMRIGMNLADAGVDLREAVEKLKLMHTITAQCGTYGVAHTYASWVEDFLRSIANAVEGTTKEEGV